MFQNRGNESSGFARGGGNEMAEIAGVGVGYGAQQTMAQTPVQSVSASALLSAFEEEDEPTVKPEPQPESKPEVKPQSTAPTSTEKSSVLTSGIELPNVLNQPSPEPTPAPDVQTVPSPTPEPAPVEIESTPQSTEVRGVCDECGQHYAVDMPIGVQQAQIACPKCGNISVIRL